MTLQAKTIAQTLRDAAVVMADPNHKYGICSAIEKADNTFREWVRGVYYVREAMSDCGIVTAYAYGEKLFSTGLISTGLISTGLISTGLISTGPKESNREARVLACLWLALEAEEEGV